MSETEGFEKWFRDRHGVWPWRGNEPPSLAWRRLADSVAEYIDKVAASPRTFGMKKHENHLQPGLYEALEVLKNLAKRNADASADYLTAVQNAEQCLLNRIEATRALGRAYGE